MVRKIIIGVATVIVLFVIVVATRPATFHIERSTTIAAPPEHAFAQVDDFRAWRNWSPWEKLDPSMNRTYGAKVSGPGATYAWVGNKEVGEGRMTIEQSTPPAKVAIKLEFIKPFAATNIATFAFQPVPSGTKVTWAMDGKNNFMAKAFHLFMDVDKMVGADFERGLSAMKALAEASARAGVQANAAK
jgi:hypothetical protein